MTSGIIQIMINNSAVQALVEESPATGKYKVYPVVAPQLEKQPFYTVLKKQNETTGQLNCIGTLDFPVYEVRAWSKEGFRKTELMHEAARLAIESESEVVTDACTFDGIHLINDYDHYESGSDMFCHIGIYRAQMKRVS